MRLKKVLSDRRYLIKLLAVTLILATLPLGVLSYFMMNRVKYDMAQQAQELAQTQLEAASLHISDRVTQCQKLIFYAVNDIAPLYVSNVFELSVVEKMKLLKALNTLASTAGDYVRVCLYHATSKQLYASLYGITSLENLRFKVLVEDVAKAQATHTAMMTAPTLIYDSARSGYYYYIAIIQPPLSSRHITGILLIQTDMLLSGYMDALALNNNTYSFYIIDKDNTIIYHSDKGKIGQTLRASDTNNLIRMSKNTGAVGLRLIVDISKHSLFDRMNATLLSMMIVIVLSIAGLVLVAVLVSFTLYRPVKQLVTTVECFDLPAESEFDLIQTAFRGMRSKYIDAVHSMEQALRMLRRTQIAGNMYGIAHTNMAQGNDKWMVLMVRAANEMTPLSMNEYVLRAIGDCERFEDNPYAAYVFRSDAGTTRELLALRDTCAEKGLYLSLSDAPCAMNQLYHGHAQALFVQKMMELLCEPGMASRHTLLERAHKHPMRKTFENAEEALVCEQAGALELLLPDGIDAKAFHERLFLTILLLIERRDNAIELLEEVNRSINADTGNISCKEGQKLVSRLIRRIHALEKRDESCMRANDAHLKAIEAYIARHYDTLLSIEDVASAIGISRQRMNEIIKENYHITFVNFLNQYRVEKAKELLVRSDLRLDKISTATGFSSNSYFIKVFKTFTGITPGEYRAYIHDEGGHHR